jgi:hypothetical protein
MMMLMAVMTQEAIHETCSYNAARRARKDSPENSQRDSGKPWSSRSSPRASTRTSCRRRV